MYLPGVAVVLSGMSVSIDRRRIVKAGKKTAVCSTGRSQFPAPDAGIAAVIALKDWIYLRSCLLTMTIAMKPLH